MPRSVETEPYPNATPKPSPNPNATPSPTLICGWSPTVSGQSEWNAASLFTGWADVPLTTLGKNEAAEGATQMWREGYKVDVAYTSLLKRAQQTLDIVLKITGQEEVPVHQNWRLNERMYGGLARTLTLA